MKALKQIFIALLAVFFIGVHANKTQAQCDIDGTAFPTTLCAGDQITLLSDGTCGYLMSNDFNNGTIGAGWSSTLANPVFTNPCPLPGPSAGPVGFYCWVGTTASTERSLITNPYDVSIGGCKVEFWMRYGIEPGSGPCEDPDASTEGVHLQYRTSSSAAWTDFPAPNLEPVGNLSLTPPFSTVTPGSGGYWQPQSSPTSQQSSTIYHWNQYVCPVPSAANSTTTQFRWAQLMTSNSGYDAWGIDEVNISCPTPAANFAWMTPATGDTVFFVQNPPMFNIYSPNSPSAITGGQYDTCWFVSIWDSLGFAATDTVCVTVNPVPTADFTVTSPICEDEIATATYTGNGTSGASYSWYFSGANPPTASTQGPHDIQWPTTPGTQWVSLQVTENGCSSPTVYDSVIVYDTPEVWFQADTTEACEPGTINFTNLSNPAGDNWVWDFGDGSTSTQQNPSHTYTSHGDYTVTLAVSTNEGCDDTLTWNNYIHIYPQPVADFTMDPDPAKPGVPVNFSSTSVGDTWLWDFGDGNSSTDANFTTHTYVNPSTYIVTLYVSNMYGCIDSLSQELLCIDLEFPNVFTPNGDGVNDQFEIKGADLLASDVNITRLRVYNRWGKKVFEAENYQNDWDGGNLADGVYFYVFEYLETENYSGSLTILRGN